MLFRKRLFTLLALLALGWIALGFWSTSTYNATRNAEVGAEVSERPGYQAGQVVGSGLALTFFLCTGLPLLLTFSLLAWRNGVGLRNERRHQEEVAHRQRVLEMMRAK
jgi:hypothetical protein